jgi:hypothetical protein
MGLLAIPKAFVAYTSRDDEVATIVFEAVRTANARPLSVRYVPWQFNDVSGRPLVSPIIENIDKSPFVVADITYFNLNVVYEIGYAIGRFKRVILVRHRLIKGDYDLGNQVGIFDTLGYLEYSNQDELSDILSAHVDDKALAFGDGLDKKGPSICRRSSHEAAFRHGTNFKD